MRSTYKGIKVVSTVGDLIETLKAFESDQILTNPTEIGNWVNKSHISSVSVFENDVDTFIKEIGLNKID
jgi:hypothetical protein